MLSNKTDLSRRSLLLSGVSFLASACAFRPYKDGGSYTNTVPRSNPTKEQGAAPLQVRDKPPIIHESFGKLSEEISKGMAEVRALYDCGVISYEDLRVPLDVLNTRRETLEAWKELKPTALSKVNPIELQMRYQPLLSSINQLFSCLPKTKSTKDTLNRTTEECWALNKDSDIYNMLMDAARHLEGPNRTEAELGIAKRRYDRLLEATKRIRGLGRDENLAENFLRRRQSSLTVSFDEAKPADQIRSYQLASRELFYHISRTLPNSNN